VARRGIHARDDVGQTAPQDLTDSQLLFELSAALELFARDAHERIPALIDVARDRASMFLTYEGRWK